MKTEQLQTKGDLKTNTKSFLTKYMVSILFVILALTGYVVSGMSPVMFLMDIVGRVSRNAFLVLSLVIPVIAGMGLNFSIVLGAMAGQTVLIFVTHWGVTGLPGIILCLVAVTPLALFLGYLTGMLFNKTKGQEMIAGLILGFFAQGIYELIFLQLVGGIIPMANETLIMSSGVGVRTTVDLTGGLKYGLDWPGAAFGYDNLLRPTLPNAVVGLFIAAVLGLLIYKFVMKKELTSKYKLAAWYSFGAIAFVLSLIEMQKASSMINIIRIPVLTWVVVITLCLFILFFKKTKLGQNMRSVGQDRHVAASSGIDVDKTRIIAVMMSMLMAAWGHIIFLQNLGAFSTYGSHEQIGLYSVAAILIGGATVSNAKISHALMGVFLFHSLFIVSPSAGRALFGNAQVGEYFRVFVAYGVIGVSLAMYAWKKLLQRKDELGI